MKWMSIVATGVVIALAGLLLTRLGDSPELPVLAELPDFRLVDSNGDALGLSDLRGQIWVADFIFTSCPSFCPRLTQQMAVVQEQVRNENGVRLVSFSVDPVTDTPERLRDYGIRHGAAPELWSFVTGSRAAMYALVRDGFKLAVAERTEAQAVDGEGIILHSDRFVLVDRAGRIRGYYHGTDDESVAALIRDATQLARARYGESPTQ